MENKLRAYMDHLFQDVPNTKKAVEVKEEILQNIVDKYHDLVAEGKSEEAKGVLKRLSMTYRGFRSFLKDAAELRLLDESEYIDEYQLYTESELVSCYQENLFLWDSRQEFFQWARKAMTPPRKKKEQTTT